MRAQVGKTCDEAEDEWDEEKEEITRLDQESEEDSDADDDVSLADRYLPSHPKPETLNPKPLTLNSIGICLRMYNVFPIHKCVCTMYVT